MSNPSLSLTFYDYLCDVIGTEDIVNTRRRILTASGHVHSNEDLTSISSGSKAEGLDLDGSDFDIMCLYNYMRVYESKDDSVTQLSGSVAFVMDTTDCKPGFTLLKQYKDMSDIQADLFCENKAGESYLSSLMIREFMPDPTCIIHGPCISTLNGSLDFARSLRCAKWILQAQPWLVRSQHSWASHNVINTFLQFGVLFVPIGSKNSPNIDLEWRISFSYAEKLLIWSFNHVQLLCYALLKILLKEIIKETTGDLLCSYFLKTVMFWICEETKPTQWKPDKIISCFMNCLNRLIYCVKYKTCAHYFIPENDLFADRFDEQQHRLLLSTLNNLQSLGWSCLLQTKTLMSFKGILVPDQSTLIHKATYLGSLNHSHGASIVCDQKLAYLVDICMRSNNKDFLIKGIADISTNIGQNLLEEDQRCNGNKKSYNIYRKRVCHFLIGLNQDALTGWLMLASFFFVNKQYQICTQILSDCLSRCTQDKILITENMSKKEHSRFNILHRKLGLRHLDFIRKFIINEYVLFTSSSQNLPEDMNAYNHGFGIFDPFPVPSVVFGLFLTFLCDHYLGNDQKKNEALRALEIVIQNKYFMNDSDGLRIAHTLLIIAYSVTFN